MLVNDMEQTEMQKVTVELPKALLQDLKEQTGLGVTALLRKSLEDLAHREAQLEILKMRGSYTPSFTIEELRAMDDE